MTLVALSTHNNRVVLAPAEPGTGGVPVAGHGSRGSTWTWQRLCQGESLRRGSVTSASTDITAQRGVIVGNVITIQ